MIKPTTKRDLEVADYVRQLVFDIFDQKYNFGKRNHWMMGCDHDFATPVETDEERRDKRLIEKGRVDFIESFMNYFKQVDFKRGY